MLKKIFLSMATASAFSFLSFQRKPAFNLKESIFRGKDIYIAQCRTCHLDQGEAIEDVYPPLAKADYLLAHKKRSIQQAWYAAKGEMKETAKTYNTEARGY